MRGSMALTDGDRPAGACYHRGRYLVGPTSYREDYMEEVQSGWTTVEVQHARVF